MTRFFLSLLLSGSILFTYAQKAVDSALKPAKPETVGMSSERLQRIDRLLQEYTSKNNAPGNPAHRYLTRT